MSKSRAEILGDSVKFNVLRQRQPLEVTVKFERAWPFLMQANSYDLQPA